jgi:peroxiredoxin
MTWIIFDESDRRVPAPHFCLPDAGGDSVCLRDFHEVCSLVLIFLHSTYPEHDPAELRAFARRLPEYQAENARILVVLPKTVDEIESDPQLAALPFALLSDPEGTTRRSYAGLMAAGLVGAGDSMIFVLDQYSAPYAAWIEKEFSSPSIHQDILGWLAFIGIQCPE